MRSAADAALLVGQLIGAMLITFIVQGVTIGAYAARLAGVQTKRIATSISLFNLFVTTGRLANLFMVFFVGPLSDQAGNAVTARRAVGAAWQHVFETQLRLIVLAGTIGMVVFALLSADVHLSLPARRAFVRGARFDSALADAACFAARLRATFCARSGCRRCASCARSTGASLPKRLLIFNTVVMCVYAIGVQASFLASVLDVNVARTAIGLSGIINGIGTIAFTLFVDPTSAMITDQAIHGKRTDRGSSVDGVLSYP